MKKPNTRISKDIYAQTLGLNISIMSLEVMSTLPVRMTFIDFRAPLPNPRSASAPPSLIWEDACSGPSAPQSRKRRKPKRPAVQRCTAREDLAILEYRSRAIEETWTHLAERLCDKSTRDARAESTFAPRLRGSLPRQLFRDWAFYTFVNQEHAAILSDLCRIGFIHENTDANLFEFRSPDVHPTLNRKMHSYEIWLRKLTSC